MAESKPSTTERDSWGTDFFGTLNTLPPQPVALIAEVLEAMRTEPTFQRARQEMLADLRLAPGATVLDGGCGTGAALPDLLAAAGPTLQVVGVDPTDAFVERARARAQQLGAAAARYETGDIRALPFPEASFDAAFCDKVLLHVGPAAAVLAELVRVTRPGGRIGAVEWCPMFVLSTSRPELAHALNDALRRAVYDFLVSANLARHFRAGGLAEVQTRVYLAQAASLEEHPFWRAFLIDQLPLFAHAGLLTEEQAQELAADLQALSGQGVFRASCVVAKAVGTKPAASH
jgi:ubiquinone/menaquinone biosynthesis C-methylase UbiE